MSSYAQHKKFIPPPDLQSYVEYIWTFKGNIGSKIRQEVIAPSAQPSLIFCFGNPGVRVDMLTGERYVNRNIFCTIATRPFIIEQEGEACYVGIELKPYGLTAFNTKSYPANTVGLLSDIFDESRLDYLLASIATRQFPGSDVQHIIAFLREQIHPAASHDLIRAATCTSLIKAADGAIRVADLARAMHVSPSTLRRTFDRCIGISPEQYIGIIRYNALSRSLVRNPDESLSILSTVHGYYDEAHAAKDFKKYTGLSRKNFLHKHDGIMQIIYER